MCIHVGCGRCWTLDGNWKLGFVHCMFPVVTKVIGVQWLNYPNVCTEEPLPNSAFCLKHSTLAKEQSIPTKLKDYVQFLNTKGNLIYLIVEVNDSLIKL